MLMQIPFPSENQAESMPEKDFLLLHLNKNKQIQTLRYWGQSSLEKLAGALFQTMAVTQKLRRKAQGAYQTNSSPLRGRIKVGVKILMEHRIREWRIA